MNTAWKLNCTHCRKVLYGRTSQSEGFCDLNCREDWFAAHGGGDMREVKREGRLLEGEAYQIMNAEWRYRTEGHTEGPCPA